MQNRKNVSRLSIVLLTVLFVTMPLRAQVTVGDTEAPHPFSLLELVAKPPTVGGLRLPQLTDAQCGDLKTFFTSGTTSSEDKVAAEGLVVYNTDAHCIFFWGDGDWVSACNETPDPRTCTSPVIVHTSGASQRIGVGANAMMSVDATGMAPLFYQWYSGIVGDEIAPVGTAQSGLYTPKLTSAGVYDYWCKVSNGYCSVNSEQFTVTVVTCGAYIAVGEWKKFMCYNLGVTNPSADPFEPSPDLFGDIYQWGCPTPAANRDGIFGVWGSAYDPSYYYGDGIDYDWVYPIEDYNQTIKSATDPCPHGYRLPNAYEWVGVGLNNTGKALGDFSYTTENRYTNGIQIGEALVLPFAGLIQYWNGKQSPYLGSDGFYWGSTYFRTDDPPYDVSADYFMCTDMIRNGVDGPSQVASGMEVTYGASIRCIEE